MVMNISFILELILKNLIKKILKRHEKTRASGEEAQVNIEIIEKQMFILTELVVKLARVYYDSQVFIIDLHSRKKSYRAKIIIYKL